MWFVSLCHYGEKGSHSTESELDLNCRLRANALIVLPGLAIAKERLESVIHMLLDVAVKKGQARLVSREIYHGSAEVRNDDRILDDACCLLPIDLSQFPQMPVQMHLDLTGHTHRLNNLANRLLIRDHISVQAIRHR